jgi:hypothetical protein
MISVRKARPTVLVLCGSVYEIDLSKGMQETLLSLIFFKT